MIQMNDVVKRYGNKTVLDGVTQTFTEGKIISIVAPNGSGKTTTLSLISGLLLPDEGTIVYSGKNGCRGVNVVLSGERNLYIKNTVRENLLYLGIIRGMSKADVEKSIEKYCVYFPLLKKIRNETVEKLSYGQKRLVSIFSAVITDAECVLLDEVTEGLDMECVRILSDMLLHISKEKIVVLASHDYDFVADISDSILFLKNGKLTEESKKYDLNGLKLRYMEVYGLKGENTDDKGDVLGN